MKIQITFEFDERVRRAIAHRIGTDKPANRVDCEGWIDSIVDGAVAELCAEYDARDEHESE